MATRLEAKMLDVAMQVIDEYLNAGCKEERIDAHKKAKILYKIYHGEEYVNRDKR